MEFHDWTSLYDHNGKAWPGGPSFSHAEEFYQYALSRPWFLDQPPWYQEQLRAEWRWYRAGRPYYSVFPAIVMPLVRLRLEFDSGLIPNPPVPVLIVRFAKGLELAVSTGRKARALLLTRGNMVQSSERGLGIWGQFIETGSIECGRLPVDGGACTVPLRSGTTLEETLEEAAAATTISTVYDPTSEATTLFF